MTYDNQKAIYACLNYGEVFYPEILNDRSVPHQINRS